jgi:hypothetical protein
MLHTQTSRRALMQGRRGLQRIRPIVTQTKQAHAQPDATEYLLGWMQTKRHAKLQETVYTLHKTWHVVFLKAASHLILLSAKASLP